MLAALSEHILRFARLARNMAQCETRDGRRTELLAIADNCDLIAHRPPRTFWQALQLCYFIQLTLQIESNGHSVSFGRLDQYLYPWYRRDVELEQNLTRENAIELLHSCWLKLLEVNKIRSGSHSKASAGSPLYQNVTIGGQNWSMAGRATRSTRCPTPYSNPAAACAPPSPTSACVTTPG